MNVTLVYPKMSQKNVEFKELSGCNPPLPLLYLAAYIRKSGYNVSILDCNADNIQGNDVVEHLDENVRVVGITSMTSTFCNAIEILNTIKNKRPDVITVLGGNHISTFPKQVMENNKCIDFGVMGEGELPFNNILKTIESNQYSDISFEGIKGISYRVNDNVAVNEPEELIYDLNKLPKPAYDLIEIEKYSPKSLELFTKEKVAYKPFMYLTTSRGCPHKCAFCASHIIWRRKLRYKSIDYVINEIDTLVSIYGIKNIHILDDSFLSDKRRASKILDRIIEKKYNCHFVCMARVDEIDEEIVRKMISAKVYHLRLGIESCSDEVLGSMKKGYDNDTIKNAFKICRDNKMLASANIIIGYPSETKDTFDRTLNRIIKYNPVLCNFFIALPLPGTEFYNNLIDAGEKFQSDWRMWQIMPSVPVVGTKDLTIKEISKLRKKAYFKFYFRFNKIIELISYINSFRKIGVCLKMGIKVLVFLFKNQTKLHKKQ